MIKVEKIDVWGFEHAIRGMRNSYDSHDKSDTIYDIEMWTPKKGLYPEVRTIIGDNDMALMQKLYKAGTSSRKFMRQIFVSMDITAPLYFWKQMDTYKVGVTMNSTSTMHTIHKKEFTLDDFSHEHLVDDDNSMILLHEILALYNRNGEYPDIEISPIGVLSIIIKCLNYYRKLYLETKDKKWWQQIIQLLPSSYNQLRTVTMNYENVVNIINQRRGHRLDEWNAFIDTMLNELPYLKEIMV